MKYHWVGKHMPTELWYVICSVLTLYFNLIFVAYNEHDGLYTWIEMKVLLLNYSGKFFLTKGKWWYQILIFFISFRSKWSLVEWLEYRNGWLKGIELSKHGHNFIWDIAESSWEQKQKDDWRNQALKTDTKNFNLIALTSMFVSLVSCVILIEWLNLLFINSFKRVYKSNMHNFNLYIYIYVYFHYYHGYKWISDVVTTLHSHSQGPISAANYNTYLFMVNKENIVILITMLFGHYLAFIISHLNC